MTRLTGAHVWTRYALGIVLAIVGVGALLFSSVGLPLVTYTTVLALFGLPHIASELRYLDYRFGSRLGRSVVLRVVGLLILAMAARAGGLLGALPFPLAGTIEILLAAVAVVTLAPAGSSVRWTAVALCLVLVTCALMAPLTTLLFLAVSHNFTPLGFLAERLRGRQRRHALALGAIGLVLLPGLIMTGLPYNWLSELGLGDPEAIVFPAAGDLLANLGAYVPSWAMGEDWALHAFSACVFAQCIHYIAVIGVLPLLIPGGSPPLVHWPKPEMFWVIVIGAGVVVFTGFAADYLVVRKLYAIVALLHAWLELPLLLVALHPPQKKPAYA
ncbi:MAG: hypothetical protein JOY64_23990 [Alphaproteobacteria bacterium]|nr:hypothetical protein [Alphaproteobacteria bacterium]